MTEILKEIYQGFDENPKRAWLEILAVLGITILLLGFLYFYAEPIPSEIPDQLRLEEGVKAMTKKKEQVPLGQELLAAILNNPKEIQMPWYRRVFRQRSGIIPISRSKYGEPHQGDQEKQRRLRQIMAGHIQNKD